MMKRLYFLFTLLLWIQGPLRAQIVEPIGIFSFSAGKLAYSGSENLFFPKGVDNNGLLFRADYLYLVRPFLRVGFEGAFALPGTPSRHYGDFSEISSNGEKLLMGGACLALEVPYHEFGLWNRLRLHFALSPLYITHTGTRTIVWDNKIYDENRQIVNPSLTMEKSSGFGLSLSPSAEYYLIQHLALRVAWSTLFTNLHTPEVSENLRLGILQFGVVVPLNRNKLIYY